MRQGNVFYKGEKAGLLSQFNDGHFEFQYEDNWLNNTSYPAISLTLPKTEERHISEYLFPFFYHLLPEGVNKQIICKHLRIDEDDYFGLLLNIAGNDTIGAVTVQKLEA